MKHTISILLLISALACVSCTNPAEQRICFFGSSVCRGVGADSLHGYAWQYTESLPKGWSSVNLSVDGNDTYDLLARFDRDLLPDDSRFVFIGLSLGNEGLHESGEAAVLSYKENLQTLVRKIRELGRIPVVALSYPRADFNPVDYEDLLNTNLEMMQWAVPTVAFLGALDDGHGRWADECWNHQDIYHPDTYGHTLLCSAIPPTLFRALAEGKPLPQRVKAQLSSAVETSTVETEYIQSLQQPSPQQPSPHQPSPHQPSPQQPSPHQPSQHQSSSHQPSPQQSSVNHIHVSFTPEPGLTSYTLSYTSADTVYTVVHSAARNLTWYYVNDECRSEFEDDDVPASFTVEGNNLSDLFFFRTPLSSREVKALVEGAMLRSSLEIYAPLTGDNPSANLAQTLNTITIKPF